jgi:hypothetical protein
VNCKQIRDILVAAGVVFEEDNFLSGFWGTRFKFHKRELKRVDKTVLKGMVKAHFKDWCIEVF